MKRRFEIYHERGVDESGTPIRETIKTFKNEPEAIAFYNDPRNNRRYGPMFMNRTTADGMSVWDDRREEWRPA